jgi:hypothetical protein
MILTCGLYGKLITSAIVGVSQKSGELEPDRAEEC